MKKFAKLIVIATILILSAFWYFSQKNSSETASAPESENFKDTIVYCQGNDLTTMDVNVGIQERACALTNNMFDSLFAFDEKMNIVPEIAEGYKWLTDKSMEIKIRKGIKFHNGVELSADDVAFTMDRINEKGSLFGNNYDNTKIVDDHTVVINLKAPYPPLVNILAVPYAGIISKKAFTEDPDGFSKHPVGTGPYKLKEFKEGDYYTLERFDGYWKEPAKTKYITMKVVPETAQRVILLETGEVDAAYDIPGSSVARIKDNEDLQVISCDSMKVTTLNINCSSKGPLGNVKVRKAIQYAIDKQMIVDSLLYGFGTVANSIIPKNAKEYAEQENYKYNPEEARKLLKEAGYTNGFKIKLWTDANQTNTEIAQVLQSQLAKVGIELSIVVQDPNTTFSLLKAGEDFDMILDFFNLVASHADLVYKRILYSTSSSNWSAYKSKEYDKAYDEYSVTPEGAKRDALREKVNTYFIKEVPVISLYNEAKIIGASSSLKGFRTSPIGSHEYQFATIEKEK